MNMYFCLYFMLAKPFPQRSRKGSKTANVFKSLMMIGINVSFYNKLSQMTEIVVAMLALPVMLIECHKMTVRSFPNYCHNNRKSVLALWQSNSKAFNSNKQKHPFTLSSTYSKIKIGFQLFKGFHFYALYLRSFN